MTFSAGGYNASGGGVQRHLSADSNLSLKSVSTLNNNTTATENLNSARNSMSDLNSARRPSMEELNKQNSSNSKLSRQGTYTTTSRNLNPLKTPPKQSHPREVSAISTSTVSTAQSSVSYSGELAKPPGKFKGNSIADTRKRIANILGRK